MYKRQTLYIVAFSLLLALPLGVGAAVYLTEYATSRKLIGLVEFATCLLYTSRCV